MKCSKERLELLVKLSNEAHEYITDKAEISGLTNFEVIEIYATLTTYVAGAIYSRSDCDLELVKEASELIGKDVSREIVRSYLFHKKKKKLNEERDNTSKDPA